jgi:hypothetical protein
MVNKAGSLLYWRDYSANPKEIVSNERLRLAGMLHGYAAYLPLAPYFLSLPEHPAPLGCLLLPLSCHQQVQTMAWKSLWPRRSKFIDFGRLEVRTCPSFCEHEAKPVLCRYSSKCTIVRASCQHYYADELSVYVFRYAVDRGNRCPASTQSKVFEDFVQAVL